MALRTFEVDRVDDYGKPTGFILEITYEYYPGCPGCPATAFDPPVGDEFYLWAVMVWKGKRRRIFPWKRCGDKVYAKLMRYIENDVRGYYD